MVGKVGGFHHEESRNLTSCEFRTGIRGPDSCDFTMKRHRGDFTNTDGDLASARDIRDWNLASTGSFL